jgi:lambda repressor-like predicted transcriptional regulator
MDIKKNPISKDHWAWIKYRLTQVGFPTWPSLACKHKYSISAFTLVKNYPFPNVEKIIAETIVMTPQDLFQNRYTADGRPIGRNYPREIRLSERKKIRNGKNKRGNNHMERKK